MNKWTNEDYRLVMAVVADFMAWASNPNITQEERERRVATTLQAYIDSIPDEKPARKKVVKK